jgi:hypothetical protein
MRAIAGFFRRLADRLAPPLAPPGRGVQPAPVLAPGLPVEELELPELGKVYLRGLLLRDRLDLVVRRGDGFANVSRMLATCVLREDRSPVLDAEGWEAYGSRHFNESIVAWDRVQELSGLVASEEPPEEKKTSARA